MASGMLSRLTAQPTTTTTTSMSPPSGGGGLASLLAHVSHAVASSGGGQQAQVSGGLSVSGAAKAVLSRPGWTIYDKANELNRLLRPSLTAYADAASSQHASTSAVSAPPPLQPAITLKDLDELFVLIVGDVFGSHAVAAARYGHGWSLTTLSRSRYSRDYYAALGFLGSSGTLARMAELLGEANLLLEYPTARLPWATHAQSTTAASDGFLRHDSYAMQSPARNEFTQVTPFEYFLYHFAALVNAGAEWYSTVTAAVDGDSLYPVLFEDYLSAHLPVGGENFRRQHMLAQSGYLHRRADAALSSSSTGRPSLLKGTYTRSPVNPAATMNEVHHHYGHHWSKQQETWRSHALVEVVTQFWLASWCEEVPVAADGSAMARVPSGDVVKMVRMFIK